jgi:L-threonylcarbamoyladenylate synthase
MAFRIVGEFLKLPCSSLGMARQSDIRKAAGLIKRGELVVFPTETLYGLGANALDEEAIRKVFVAKGRPEDKGLIVLVSDKKMLKRIVKRIPPTAEKLMKEFWPGPLTIIFEKNKGLPTSLSSNDTIAVRIPGNPATLSLIKKAGVPIVAPSANPSGKRPPETAAQVRSYFKKFLILEDDSSLGGVPSTIISLSPPKIIRLGAISKERLKKVVPKLR